MNSQGRKAKHRVSELLQALLFMAVSIETLPNKSHIGSLCFSALFHLFWQTCRSNTKAQQPKPFKSSFFQGPSGAFVLAFARSIFKLATNLIGCKKQRQVFRSKGVLFKQTVSLEDALQNSIFW